jgi:ankyrin repeat protein
MASPLSDLERLFNAIDDDDDIEVLELLQRPGLSANSMFEGSTAVEEAAGVGSRRVMRVLLEHKPDVHRKDDFGRTALMKAVELDDADVVVELLRMGADANARDAFDFTALMFATHCHKNQSVAALLRAGVDVDVQSMRGQTALMFAIVKCNMEAAELLVCAGANLDVQDAYGLTALMHAATFLNTSRLNYMNQSAARMEGVIDMLLRNGADPRLANKNGRTADACLSARMGPSVSDMAQRIQAEGMALYQSRAHKFNREPVPFRASRKRKAHIGDIPEHVVDNISKKLQHLNKRSKRGVIAGLPFVHNTM